MLLERWEYFFSHGIENRGKRGKKKKNNYSKKYEKITIFVSD